jgi:WD40 repeat protein
VGCRDRDCHRVCSRESQFIGPFSHLFARWEQASPSVGRQHSTPVGLVDGTAVETALEGHSSLVISTVFSPDGSKLASTLNDKVICPWMSTPGLFSIENYFHSKVQHSCQVLIPRPFSPSDSLVPFDAGDNFPHLQVFDQGPTTIRSKRHFQNLYVNSS